MGAATTFLSSAEQTAVAEAIAKVEQKTTGELVVAVASASGKYDRAEDIVGLLVGLAAVVGSGLLCSKFAIVTPSGTADWSGGGSWACLILIQAASLVVGFGIGAALATYIPALAMVFVSQKEMTEEVDRRAHEIFARERVRNTAGGTGMLLLLSLREHRVRVLPDDAILALVPQEQWDSICNSITSGIKQNRAADGLCEAVALGGRLLEQHFPQSSGTEVNELQNHVRIYD